MDIKMTRVVYQLACFLYLVDERPRLLLKLTLSHAKFIITFKIFRVLLYTYTG